MNFTYLPVHCPAAGDLGAFHEALIQCGVVVKWFMVIARAECLYIKLDNSKGIKLVYSLSSITTISTIGSSHDKKKKWMIPILNNYEILYPQHSNPIRRSLTTVALLHHPPSLHLLLLQGIRIVTMFNTQAPNI